LSREKKEVERERYEGKEKEPVQNQEKRKVEMTGNS
jgi:hypothetical protein